MTPRAETRDLPPEVNKKLTGTLANRSLRVWFVIFVLLAATGDWGGAAERGGLKSG